MDETRKRRLSALLVVLIALVCCAGALFFTSGTRMENTNTWKKSRLKPHTE